MKKKIKPQKWIVVAETLWKTIWVESLYRHTAEFSRRKKGALKFNTPREAALCIDMIKRNYPYMNLFIERIGGD